VRGGGLYAVGFAARVIFREVRTLVSEISESSSVGEFLSEQLIEFVFRFAMTSIMNTVEALIWLVYVIELSPPFGAIGLGIAFLVFTNYLKKPIERWLFPEDDLP
jgi:hypothetical protein